MIKVRVLAKKCDVKWLTLKINLTIQCIFKKMKNVSMDKKMISLIMNGILKILWFVHIFLQN